LKELLECFSENEVHIATLIQPIGSREELENPNVVKVVVDEHFNALYFSRAVIPHVRDKKAGSWFENNRFYAHIGLYAFRADILEMTVSLSPTYLELTESLEQLRWMQHGIPIRTRITLHKSPGVDTPEDLEKLRSMI
jgi:3-deoxy-manno-octulosonate cytidylyltransferase (CMP-KDO synthetase)